MRNRPASGCISVSEMPQRGQIIQPRATPWESPVQPDQALKGRNKNLANPNGWRGSPSVKAGGASVPASRSQETLSNQAAREYARPT